MKVKSPSWSPGSYHMYEMLLGMPHTVNMTQLSLHENEEKYGEFNCIAPYQPYMLLHTLITTLEAMPYMLLHTLITTLEALNYQDNLKTSSGHTNQCFGCFYVRRLLSYAQIQYYRRPVNFWKHRGCQKCRVHTLDGNLCLWFLLRSKHMIANYLCCPAHLVMVSLMRDCDVLVSSPFDQCIVACY